MRALLELLERRAERRERRRELAELLELVERRARWGAAAVYGWEPSDPRALRTDGSATARTAPRLPAPRAEWERKSMPRVRVTGWDSAGRPRRTVVRGPLG